MRRLFAENFTVPLLDAPGTQPELRYDEKRQLNVTADGRPFIELGGHGSTETLTEVRAEQDDYDRPDDEDGAHLDTTTKVRRESDDFAHSLLCGTETRQAPGERDDFARAERLLGTETAIGGEADDFAEAHGRDHRQARSVAWADTKTSVRQEADDFADDVGEGATVGE